MDVPRKGDWWTLHRAVAGNGVRVQSKAALTEAVRGETVRLLHAQGASESFECPASAVAKARPTFALSDESLESVVQSAHRLVANPPFYPVLTLHATQNVDVVSSVERHGLLAAGDSMPGIGTRVGTAHGAAFGHGVYTSTSLAVSRWFSFLDRRSAVQLIVCLVWPGVVGWVTDDEPADLDLVSHKAGIAYRVPNPAYDESIRYAVHGRFGDGSNTRATPDLSVLVSASPSSVLPILTLTLTPLWQAEHIRPYLFLPRNGQLVDLQEVLARQPDPDAPPVTFVHLTDDLSVVVLPPTDEQTSPPGGDEASLLLAVPTSVWTSHAARRSLAEVATTCAPARGRTTLGCWSRRGWRRRVCAAGAESDAVNTFVLGGDEPLAVVVDDLGRSCLAVVDDALVRATADSATDSLITLILAVDRATLDSLADADIDQLLARHSSVLSLRRVAVRLVAVGPDAESHPRFTSLRRLKSTWQTVGGFEALWHSVAGDHEWPAVCRALVDEAMVDAAASASCGGATVRLAVPWPLGLVGEGFVTSLLAQPAWDAQLSATSTLYKGRPPPRLWFNHTCCATRCFPLVGTVNEVRTREEGQLVSWQRARKRGSTELAERRGEAVQAADDRRQLVARATSHAASAVVRLLSAVRLAVADSPARAAAVASTVRKLCDALHRSLAAVLTDEDVARCADLRRLQTAANHAVALQGHLDVLSKLDSSSGANAGATTSSFHRLAAMRFGSAAVRRIHRASASSPRPSDLPPELDLGQVLASMPWSGIAVRIRRHAAADVEPWRIVVQHVSADRLAVARLVVAAAAGVKVRDSTKRVVNECLLDGVDATPPTVPITYLDRRGRRAVAHVDGAVVRAAYHGWAFTRVPSLSQPAQPFALLGVAWVRAVESIFRSRYATADDGADDRHNALFYRTVWPLAQRIAVEFRRDSEARGWLDALAAAGDDDSGLSGLLTTEANVQSLARLLCVMLTDKNVRLPSRLPFLLLAEATARSARVCQRRTRKQPRELIRAALRLPDDDDGGDDDNNEAGRVDVAAAAARTNSFFRTRYDNCTPFAVVSVLGFVQRWRADTAPASVLAALRGAEPGISMGAFLAESLPQQASHPQLVQLALFVHGHQYHDASARRHLDFSDPRAVVDVAVAEERAAVAAERAASAAAANRTAVRAAARLAVAAPYRKYHAMVKLFSEAEVAALNATRDPADQLERLPTGLLMYHCSHPACPSYLKRFQTATDRARAESRDRRVVRTRHGLMAHLQYDHSLSFYIPSFHLHAKRAHRTAESFDDFCAAMTKSCLVDRRGNRRVVDEAHFRSHLQAAWEFWRGT